MTCGAAPGDGFGEGLGDGDGWGEGEGLGEGLGDGLGDDDGLEVAPGARGGTAGAPGRPLGDGEVFTAFDCGQNEELPAPKEDGVAARRVEGTPPNATATAVTTTDVTRAAQAAMMITLDFMPYGSRTKSVAFGPGPSVLRIPGAALLNIIPPLSPKAMCPSGFH